MDKISMKIKDRLLPDINSTTGKTVKEVIKDYFPSSMGTLSFIVFDDDSMLRVCTFEGETPDEDQAELNEKVRNLFIRLWDQAGTSQYDKQQWKELQYLLEKFGVRW